MFLLASLAQMEGGELTVSGTRFLMDDRPFPYTGLSFFNAIYNTNFNASSEARNGTSQFGGPKAATSPFDHILQIQAVWQLGAYTTYHHDMFQTAYGTPACPPSGVTDPEFSPYHKQVFEFLKLRDKYVPK